MHNRSLYIILSHVMCIMLLLPTLPALAKNSVLPEASWQQLEDGLNLARFPIPNHTEAEQAITVLRIDPAKFDFMLLTASEHGKSYTPAQWGRVYSLSAVINASMYLPDRIKSTGYLRNGTHVNNGRINSRFGAFFVASPTAPGLPPAMLVDRQHDDWESLINKYHIVTQNYRILSSLGTPLWPETGDAFSISAIGMDFSGNILFIHCREPMTVRELSLNLLKLPLSIQQAMYVEGGPEASLHVRSKDIVQTWSGRHMGDFWSGARTQWPLPNMLGIKKKSQ